MQALTPAVGLSFDHAFAYGQVQGRRPMVMLELAGVDNAGRLLGSVANTPVLVDSGADTTMLNAGIALNLGLDLAAMPTEPVYGVGGGTQAMRHRILARLCSKWVVLPVLFEVGRNINLLGRDGAFDELRLGFLHSQSIVVANLHP